MTPPKEVKQEFDGALDGYIEQLAKAFEEHVAEYEDAKAKSTGVMDMPFPKPHSGESQDDFISRCMSEEKEGIPDQDQRTAACFDAWRKEHGGKKPSSRAKTQSVKEDKEDEMPDMKNITLDLIYKNKPADDGFSIKAQRREAEVLIYGEIGDELFGGVSAKTFAAELKSAGKLDKISLRLNSPGGNVFDGMAIFNTLQAHSAEVTVHIDGLAASAASIVAMAGQRIYAAENAIIMIHDPWALVIGSADQMRAMAVSLDKIAEGMSKTYARRTGKSLSEVRKWMSEETWFSAEDAAKAGLIDEITEPMKAAAHFDIMAWRKRFRHPPEFDLEPEDPGTPISAYKDRWRQFERMKISGKLQA